MGRGIRDTFIDDLWKDATDRIRSTTSYARLGLIQFKVPNRVHFSKSRLSGIYPELEDRCEKCQGSPCHLSHMFFLCPGLKSFWTSYFSILSAVLGVNLHPSTDRYISHSRLCTSFKHYTKGYYNFHIFNSKAGLIVKLEVW